MPQFDRGKVNSAKARMIQHGQDCREYVINLFNDLAEEMAVIAQDEFAQTCWDTIPVHKLGMLAPGAVLHRHLVWQQLLHHAYALEVAVPQMSSTHSRIEAKPDDGAHTP